MASVVNDFAEGTRTVYDLSFVCGPDLEGKEGKRKLQQGRQNFGATGAAEIYLVADCTLLVSSEY